MLSPLKVNGFAETFPEFIETPRARNYTKFDTLRQCKILTIELYFAGLIKFQEI